MLDNVQGLLTSAWHGMVPSISLSAEPTEVLLLGRSWWLARSGAAVSAHDGAGRHPYAVVERYGMVWMAAEEPLGDFPDFPQLPEHEDPAFATGVLQRRTPVSAGVLTDNFLDVSHFSYLHSGSFGRRVPVTTESLFVEQTPQGLQVRHETDLRAGADGERPAAAGVSGSWRVATYTVAAPFVTHLQMHFPATGHRSAATLVCRPESARSTAVTVLVSWPAGDDEGLLAQLDFSAEVLEEDLRMLELMADPRLLLSLHAELHTRADRASVEYRRLLARFLELAAGRRQVELPSDERVVARAPGR